MDDNHNPSDMSGVSDEMLASFLDGDVGMDEADAVMSAMQQDPEVAEILSLSPLIDHEIEKEKRRILPMLALAAANPENLCSFECETYILREIGYDIDSWSLLETAKANNWVREEGTPLHHVGRLMELKGVNVKRIYDASSGDIKKALAEHKRVMAVVDKDILMGNEESDTSALHAILITDIDTEEGCDIRYLDVHNGMERVADGSEFLRAWKRSDHYMVTASPTSSGYNPQPIDVEDIDLDADLEELTEAIAENAHDVWARARIDEGWTYGPVRDDAKRQHPDLVPYSQLPESEKEYDRLMAMNTLRLVRRLGYDIMKP